MTKLSTKKGTIGKVISDNLTQINTTKSKNELIALMVSLLDESKNSDKERFLDTLRGKKNHVDAMTFCYNYMFAGDGLRAM